MKAFENANTTKLINQIKAAKDQYPVLSKEEERALIEKYRNDRDKLNQLLCLHNVKMVFSMARSFVTKTKDFDSLVQNGMLGLMEAAKRFDLDKNIKFCTYASIWIRKYFSMHYYTAQYKMDQATCSLDEPAAFGSDDPADETSFLENSLHKYLDPSYQGTVKSVDEIISASENAELCAKLYSKLEADTSLSSVEKDVFFKLFVDNEKARDVAAEYKMDPSAVAEIRRKVLGKFRNILAADYGITEYG
jgi:RNA polymerase sigma factor (sigma-70 family)